MCLGQNSTPSPRSDHWACNPVSWSHCTHITVVDVIRIVFQFRTVSPARSGTALSKTESGEARRALPQRAASHPAAPIARELRP